MLIMKQKLSSIGYCPSNMQKVNIQYFQLNPKDLQLKIKATSDNNNLPEDGKLYTDKEDLIVADEIKECKKKCKTGKDVVSGNHDTSSKLTLDVNCLSVPAAEMLCLSPDSAMNMSMITDLPEDPNSNKNDDTGEYLLSVWCN